MSSKNQILSRIRRQTLPEAALPGLSENWIRYPDRAAQFRDVLSSVGGAAHTVNDRAQLAAAVAALECVQSAKKTVCTVPGLEFGNVPLGSVVDPHAVADVDVAIIAGDFAVAENGAVWVSDRDLAQRVILFLTQHLVLVVEQASVLDNMHEAYERLSFEGRGYGVFISGPSKTADIEQSLVIGAHGPRSLNVFLSA